MNSQLLQRFPKSVWPKLKSPNSSRSKASPEILPQSPIDQCNYDRRRGVCSTNLKAEHYLSAKMGSNVTTIIRSFQQSSFLQPTHCESHHLPHLLTSNTYKSHRIKKSLNFNKLSFKSSKARREITKNYWRYKVTSEITSSILSMSRQIIRQQQLSSSSIVKLDIANNFPQHSQSSLD